MKDADTNTCGDICDQLHDRFCDHFFGTEKSLILSCMDHGVVHATGCVDFSLSSYLPEHLPPENFQAFQLRGFRDR